jgi:cytochrome c
MRFTLKSLTVAVALLFAANVHAGMSTDRATEIAQDSKCFKCHGIDKKKDGPSWREIAAKYKSSKWLATHKPADARPAVIHHITSGEDVEFEDGHKEAHKKIKTNDAAETADFAEWLLGL